MIYALLAGLFGHFQADFVLQSRKMAINKSKDVKVLARHCLDHAGVLLAVGVIFAPLKAAFLFAAINTILHGVIDWNIWRGYKHLRRNEDIATFKFWEDHMFWMTVGFDQFLHISILVITTFWLLK